LKLKSPAINPVELKNKISERHSHYEYHIRELNTAPTEKFLLKMQSTSPEVKNVISLCKNYLEKKGQFINLEQEASNTITNTITTIDQQKQNLLKQKQELQVTHDSIKDSVSLFFKKIKQFQSSSFITQEFIQLNEKIKQYELNIAVWNKQKTALIQHITNQYRLAQDEENRLINIHANMKPIIDNLNKADIEAFSHWFNDLQNIYDQVTTTCKKNEENIKHAKQHLQTELKRVPREDIDNCSKYQSLLAPKKQAPVDSLLAEEAIKQIDSTSYYTGYVFATSKQRWEGLGEEAKKVWINFNAALENYTNTSNHRGPGYAWTAVAGQPAFIKQLIQKAHKLDETLKSIELDKNQCAILFTELSTQHELLVKSLSHDDQLNYMVISDNIKTRIQEYQKLLKKISLPGAEFNILESIKLTDKQVKTYEEVLQKISHGSNNLMIVNLI
jgi:hypothetical protein